jgi:rod shape-determining protein MreC
MRHVSVEPPPFFHRGPSPLARLAFFGVLSLTLLFADTRYRYLEGIRAIATVVLSPLHRAVQVPGDVYAWIGGYFASKQALSDENAALKQDILARAPLVQGYGQMQEENGRLKVLVGVESRYAGAATAVEVLYTGRDPFSQKLFVNRGSDSGIKAGEAVIDEIGVVGQVTRVFPSMAEVTLITDKDHAVPVRVERSGVRSVFFGAGSGRPPELRFMAPSADIRVGDKLYTSGMDGTYPAGLAVAQVETVERDTGQMFARINCKPLSGVDRSQFLLVLGQSAAQPPRPEEPVDPETVKKGRGKGRRGG